MLKQWFHDTELYKFIATGRKDKFVLFFPLQGNRFEISAVGSLCLPKLVFYTPSAFHSKHILRHLSDSHRLHINTRDAVSYLQQLEDTEGPGHHLNTSKQGILKKSKCRWVNKRPKPQLDSFFSSHRGFDASRLFNAT